MDDRLEFSLSMLKRDRSSRTNWSRLSLKRKHMQVAKSNITEQKEGSRRYHKEVTPIAASLPVIDVDHLQSDEAHIGEVQRLVDCAAGTRA